MNFEKWCTSEGYQDKNTGGFDHPLGLALRKAREKSAEVNARSAPKTNPPSISDEMMDLADRLGSEWDRVDPRAWAHLMVYAPVGSQWQPIESRPPYRGPILVLADDGAIALAKDFTLTPITGTSDSFCYGDRLTHWMPLPQPPKAAK